MNPRLKSLIYWYIVHIQMQVQMCENEKFKPDD